MSDAGISAYVVPADAAEASAAASAAAAPEVSVASTAYAEPYRAPKKSAGTTIVFAVLIVLVILVLWFALRPHNLAARLARRGWILYVRPGCGYCTQQQRVLGTDHYRLKVVCLGGAGGAGAAIEPATLAETDAPVLCSKVQAFPFWYDRRTGATRKGLQDRKALEAMLQ